MTISVIMRLRIKCSSCGSWNRIKVNKLLFVQPSKESKAKDIVPLYMPSKDESCKKCGTIIVEHNELIKISE